MLIRSSQLKCFCFLINLKWNYPPILSTICQIIHLLQILLLHILLHLHYFIAQFFFNQNPEYFSNQSINIFHYAECGSISCSSPVLYAICGRQCDVVRNRMWKEISQFSLFFPETRSQFSICHCHGHQKYWRRPFSHLQVGKFPKVKLAFNPFVQ